MKRSFPDDDQVEGVGEEPVPKKLYMEGDAVITTEEGETIEDRVRHSPRSCAIRPDDGAILRQCLEYLHKNLQK